jgi:hypothetical protein
MMRLEGCRDGRPPEQLAGSGGELDQAASLGRNERSTQYLLGLLSSMKTAIDLL